MSLDRKLREAEREAILGDPTNLNRLYRRHGLVNTVSTKPLGPVQLADNLCANCEEAGRPRWSRCSYCASCRIALDQLGHRKQDKPWAHSGIMVRADGHITEMKAPYHGMYPCSCTEASNV